jgi:hypothetical protein
MKLNDHTSSKKRARRGYLKIGAFVMPEVEIPPPSVTLQLHRTEVEKKVIVPQSRIPAPSPTQLAAPNGFSRRTSRSQ